MENSIKANLNAADIKKILYNNKKPLLVFVVVLAALFATFFTFSYFESLDQMKSWNKFNAFINTSKTTDPMNDEDIDGIIKDLKDTSAEPWSLYYCSLLYLKKNNTIKSKELLDSIKKQYSDHYVYLNDDYYHNLEKMITKNMEWENR